VEGLRCSTDPDGLRFITELEKLSQTLSNAFGIAVFQNTDEKDLQGYFLFKKSVLIYPIRVIRVLKILPFMANKKLPTLKEC
jgi:hypothetical protein